MNNSLTFEAEPFESYMELGEELESDEMMSPYGELGSAKLAKGGVYRHPRLGFVRSVPRSQLQGEMQDMEEEDTIPGAANVPILDTLKIPFRWICRLELDFGPNRSAPGENVIASGSGTLISPRHVLTAGHCLADDPGDGVFRKVVSVKVTPGYNCAGKTSSPLGFARSVAANSHPKWETSQDNQFDFGVITLKTALGSQPQKALGNKPLGFWGSKDFGADTRINPIDPKVLGNIKVNLSGYPGNRCCFKLFDPTKNCRSESFAGAQFYGFGKVTNSSPPAAPRLVLYSNDTFGGHSGCPVWVNWQGFRNLMAIHTGPGWVVDPGEARKSNRGVRITPDVMKAVRSLMK